MPTPRRAHTAGGDPSSWNTVNRKPAGASSRALSERHGVSTGPPIRLAPELVSGDEVATDDEEHLDSEEATRPKIALALRAQRLARVEPAHTPPVQHRGRVGDQ